MKRRLIIAVFGLIALSGCTENYSRGERIGLVTEFSQTGLIWTTQDGKLNMTQTGMNSSSSVPFSFSIDRSDKLGVNRIVVDQIKKAADSGWKVKLIYHTAMARNWFCQRGETDNFIDKVVVLDKNPMGKEIESNNVSKVSGKIIDTIYVVIDKSELSI